MTFKAENPRKTAIGRPAYTCSDYRAEMTLLMLNRRLNDEALSPQDRAAIAERIKELEIEMGLD